MCMVILKKEVGMADLSGKIGSISVTVLWIAAAALILGGCATLDKDECINADWKSIGYEDGARGYKASHIGQHRKACAKHGVAPDFDLYENGRRKGLMEWCTPRNGYRLGRQGKLYNGVCPNTLEPAFVEALDRGRALYAYEKEVTKQEEQMKKMMAELDAIEGHIHALETELVSDGVSPRRRMQLLEEIRRLEDDRRYFLNDIDDMEHTLMDMRANLERMRAEYPYR